MYLQYGLEPANMAKIQQQARECLRPIADKFDFVACRGCSGLLVAPMIAYDLSKPLVVVRKREEQSHSCSTIEEPSRPTGGYKSYIIVDDFGSSGKTIMTIMKELKAITNASLYGVYFWNESYNTPADGPGVTRSFTEYIWNGSTSVPKATLTVLLLNVRSTRL